MQSQLQQERRLVSFDSYDITIRQLLDMFESKDVYIPPEYQRHFIWDEKRESELIESFFLGIPVPSLFMATNTDSTWEVVDGVQRLGTLAHFAGSDQSLNRIDKSKPLVICGLEKLESLNNFSFKNLPKSIQLMFNTRPIRITVLNDKSDLSVRFDLFERLNTGGVSLTEQEIRNCVFRGQFNDAIKELSKFEEFNTVVKLKLSDQKNGTKEEMILRYFAYFDKYEEFDHSVKDFLNDYMKSVSKKSPKQTQIELFEITFKSLSKALPEGIIRGNRSITPMNLFEAISVGTALAIKKGKTISARTLKRLLNDEELRKMTTGATNSRKMVTGRINYVRDAFK